MDVLVLVTIAWDLTTLWYNLRVFRFPRFPFDQAWWGCSFCIGLSALFYLFHLSWWCFLAFVWLCLVLLFA